MKIFELKPAKNSKKKPVRVGRGRGSGLGKTSGKGHKGQQSRSGGTKGPGFEGGQMPLQRRLPKRGFKNEPFKKEYCVINLKTISSLDINDITPEVLKSLRVVKDMKDGIKILGSGELQKPVNIKAHAFSESALQKIKSIGGTAEVIEK